MNKMKRFGVLSCCCAGLLFSACGGNPARSQNETESSIAPTENASIPPADSLNAPTRTPVLNDKVLLYLDASHSMAGYLDAVSDTRFHDVIASLLYWKPLEAHLFDTKEGAQISRDKFAELINSRKIGWADESDLKKMIASMVEKVNNNSVGIACLITDGIMSGSNLEIKNSPERTYNKQQRADLRLGIANAVSKSNDDTAILLIKFVSAFKGTYYCFNNSKIQLDEKPRPFYVIAIGQRPLVKELLNQTRKNELLAANQGVLLLGDDYPYNISLFPDRSSGNGISQDNDLVVISSKIRSKDSVALLGSLETLPEYMRSTDYLAKNGEVMIQYARKGDFKTLGPEYYAYEINDSQLKLKVRSSVLRRNALIFRLGFDLPDWVGQTSCDDDLNAGKSLIPKTFNFEHFVKGLASINKDEYITRIDTIRFK